MVGLSEAGVGDALASHPCSNGSGAATRQCTLEISLGRAHPLHGPAVTAGSDADELIQDHALSRMRTPPLLGLAGATGGRAGGLHGR